MHTEPITYFIHKLLNSKFWKITAYSILPINPIKNIIFLRLIKLNKDNLTYEQYKMTSLLEISRNKSTQKHFFLAVIFPNTIMQNLA